MLEFNKDCGCYELTLDLVGVGSVLAESLVLYHIIRVRIGIA